MTIAFVRNNGTGTPTSSASVASSTYTMAAGYSAGSFIAVWALSFSGTITGMTDNLGNTYTLALSVANNSGADVSSLWTCASAVAGVATITVTFSTPIGWNSICVSEFSGVSATPDKTATFTNATSTALNTGTTAATTQANELVLALLEAHMSASTAGVTCTTPPGYTALPSVCADNLGGGQFFYTYPFYQIVAATGAQSAAGTLSTAMAFGNGLIATFPAGGGGSGGRVPNTPTLLSIPGVVGL